LVKLTPEIYTNQHLIAVKVKFNKCYINYYINQQEQLTLHTNH